jgi:biopolymer transport protein ExbB/TolQ
VAKSSKSSQSPGSSPILWGALLSLGFYGLFRYAAPNSAFFNKYFASHPVEYVATVMFFVGLAALGIKALEIAAQYRGLARPLLGPIPVGGQPVTDCQSLAARLKRLPQRQQRGYFVRRLLTALEYVRRTGSAETLDDELKYLADLDAGRAHASYGLVRMFIWAIPILGFLGTVIGIAQAMGNLAPQALEDSLPQVMAGLTVAFDTTKLALGLSIVLMFAQFLTDRAENALLTEVDRRVDEELVGRFEHLTSGPDGQLTAVRRMVETLIDSTKKIVQQQAELWQTSLEARERRWATMAEAAGEQLQTALAAALEESLTVHAREVVTAQQRANDANRHQWQPLQDALIRNTETVAHLQGTVVEKAEMLGRALESADQVVTLQHALNNNLRVLAGAKNFEETVMSLAAAIHLLTARLGDLPPEAPGVELDPARQTGQAA